MREVKGNSYSVSTNQLFSNWMPQDATGENVLSRSDIQVRANQLARALHILDRNECAMNETRKEVDFGIAAREPRTIQAFFGSHKRSPSGLIEIEVAGKAAIVANTVDLSSE